MATPIVMPRLGDFMTEGTVVRLARSQGDQVGRGEVIAEIETEKLNYDLEAVAGGIFHPVVVEGATVAVDGLIGYVLGGGRERLPNRRRHKRQSAPTSTPQAPARRPAAASGGGGAFRSTPGARKVAASLGRRSLTGHAHRPRRPDRRGRRSSIRRAAVRRPGRSTVHAGSAPTRVQPRR